MTTETAAELQAKADAFVKARHGKLNPAQKASLAKLRKRIAAARVAEAHSAGGTHVAVKPIDIGDDPLPNNAQPLPEGFSYEDTGLDEASYKAKHGRSPQDSANQALTAILRPDFSQHYDLIEKTAGNFTSADADARSKEGLTKQQAAIDYLAGKIPWSHVVGYLGLSRAELGAITIADIRDLGA